MKIVALSIKQPITVSVCVIIAILAGIVALNRVPVQLTPEIEDTVIAVTTTWENASPQEVESEIVDEQEERLQGVTNLREMTSVSQRGQGQIRLEFITGTSKEVAMREVSDKLREVPSYPANVDEPVITDTDPNSRDFIAWIILFSSDPDFDVSTLFDAVDKRVKPLFERLPGVAEVGVYGGREREVQIRVDPVRLAQRGITVSHFLEAVRTANENFSGGALADAKMDVRIRAVGRFRDTEQVKNIVVKKEPAGPVYIRDVADVVMTYKEQNSFVRSKGRNVIAVNFQREIGANVIDVMYGVKAEMERMNQPGGVLDNIANDAGINGDLRFFLSYDQTRYIHQALNLVYDNILLGGALATITLLLFLRSLRTIGIIAIAIPISVVASIVLLVSMGRTINVISLAGMAFAVGMVVDNAIVVLENIFRHLEMGKSTRRAAYDGASEVSGAVLASTLTTLIVFIPVLLIQETAGQLFRDIALAICASVGLSYLVSISVIPSAASKWLPEHFIRSRKEEAAVNSPSRNPMIRASKSIWFILTWPFRFIHNFASFVGNFLAFLSRSVALRLAIVALFLFVTIAGTYFLMPPVDYLPTGNRNIVFGMLIPPPGYNMNQLLEIGGRIESRVRPAWEAYDRMMEENLAPNQVEVDLPPLPTGPEPNSPMILPPPISQYFLVSAAGRMFHGGISADDQKVVDLVPLFRYATAPEVVPGVIAFAFQMPLFRIGGNTGSAVNVDLSGPDLNNVSNSASALYGTIVQKYGSYTLQPEPSNFNIPSPEIQFIPKMIPLSDLDLTVRDLGQAVQVNSDGAFAGDFEVSGELIDLKVISKDSVDQTTINGIASVPLATPDGSIVTLGSIAEIMRVAEADQIKRVSRQRAVTLQFTPPTGMPLQHAIDDISAMIADLKGNHGITPDVEAHLAGSASKLQEMKEALLGDGTLVGTLSSSLFLALLVVYLLMCVLFQSWIYPLVIMVTVPLATFGGLLTLAGVHHWSLVERYLPVQNMDVLTILGFVILAGVVVNNAILIVHQTLNFMSGRGEGAERTESLGPQEAIVKSVESRVRPIMMSTLTSVGGMLPLVLMPGAGSELYRGLGSVVVGGLLFSAIFTLVLIPVILSLVFDLKLAVQRTDTLELPAAFKEEGVM